MRHLVVLLLSLMTLTVVLKGWQPIQMGVTLLCAGILVVLLYRIYLGRREVFWVVLALAFSAAGDWFLSNTRGNESLFIAGVICFTGAHTGFLMYALSHGKLHRLVLVLLLVGYVPYYFIMLLPAIGNPLMAVAVLVYLLISCAVFAAASGMHLGVLPKALYMIAMGLILFSDTLISFKEFLNWDRWNGLILPTYYFALLCVGWSVYCQVPSVEKQA